MRPFLKLFDPLRQAAAAFFRHDLALKRDDAGLQIVLEPKPPAPPRQSKKVKREDEARRREKAELALILAQLEALLAEVPESRQALRHLVFVEQALQKKGLKALHKLPLEVLQRGLEQFEGLVTNWSPAGLANLRSKMAVAIIDREHMDPEAENDAYRTAAVLDTAPVTPPPTAAATPAGDNSLFMDDDEALAKAYAAIGAMPSTGEVEFQGELGSKSARAVAPKMPRVTETAGDIKLRVEV